MTTPNFLVYLLFCLYLWLAWRCFKTRKDSAKAYRAFLWSLLPAGLLVCLGMTIGARPLPKQKLVIHGYRLALPEKGVFLGSDVLGDQLRLFHRSKDREWFSPGLVNIRPLDDGRFRITQTDPQSPNVVSINGRPLRSLPLATNTNHVITFGLLGHKRDSQTKLNLRIEGNRPVFSFRGKDYKKGFVREGFGGWLSKPYGNGVLRHLAIGQRLPLVGLPAAPSELLRQAAVFKYQNQWWLAANDADIQLDGQSFPNTQTIAGGSWLKLESRQLGAGQKRYRFRMVGSQKDGDELFLAFAEEMRPVFPLANRTNRHNDRICLTASESHFSDTVDLIDPQFPAAGTVIHREGGGFVFRGEIMVLDKLYSAGKAVFSIDQLHPVRLKAIAGFALLFLCSVFFFPPSFIRREPLIGVVLSGAIFLLGFRQVLAFRAWQGPPFKTSVLFDSLTAPLLFILIVLALTTKFQGGSLWTRTWQKFHNFLRPKNRLPLSPVYKNQTGWPILAAAGFGIVVYGLLPDKLGFQLPSLIFGCLGLAALISSFDFLETRLSQRAASRPGKSRWLPIFWLIGLFLGFIVLAPLFGSREVIAVLPGRPRPDIFIQVFLIFTAAYFAAIWEREATMRVPRPWIILLTFALTVTIPLIQGTVSKDMGFFLMATPPLVIVLILATWHLDPRLRVLMATTAFLFVGGIWFVKMAYINLDQLSMRRVAFFIDPARLKAEYFFEYLAHLPILWVGDQGFFGGGFFTGDWYSALGETSVNDNVASVFIQGEFGSFGTLLTMAVFGSMALAMVMFLAENGRVRGFRVWFLLAVLLSMVWTAATMFLANLGVFPLTGKNLPFLGIDSLNDVVRYGLLFGFGIRYMHALKEQ